MRLFGTGRTNGDVRGRQRDVKARLAESEVTHSDLARGTGSAFLARGGAVLGVVAQPAYVWMFGLATYGLYTALWSLINLLENIFDVGMTSALQRVVPQSKCEEEAAASLRAALLVGVLPCLALAIVASVGAEWVAAMFNASPADRPQLATAVAVFAWALPLWAFVEICTSAVRARRGFGPEIRVRLMWQEVVRVGLAFPLWLAGVDTLGLIIAHLASLAVTCVLAVRLLSRYYDLSLLVRLPNDGHANRETLLAGLSVLPSNIVGRIFGDAPPLILNLWFPGAAGASAAGLYAIARKLSGLVRTIGVALSYVVGPLASSVRARDIAAVEPLYAFATRLATVWALPIAAVLIAAGRDVLSLVGPGAGAAWPLFVPLVLARTLDAVTGPGSAILQVASARSHPMVGSLLGLSVAALLVLLLIGPLGVGGLAIAVAAGLSTASLVTALQLRIHAKLSPFRRPYGRVLLTTGAVSLAAALILEAASPALADWAKAALYVTVLGAAIWLSLRFALPTEDRLALGRFAIVLRLLRQGC